MRLSWLVYLNPMDYTTLCSWPEKIFQFKWYLRGRKYYLSILLEKLTDTVYFEKFYFFIHTHTKQTSFWKTIFSDSEGTKMDIAINFRCLKILKITIKYLSVVGLFCVKNAVKCVKILFCVSKNADWTETRIILFNNKIFVKKSYVLLQHEIIIIFFFWVSF